MSWSGRFHDEDCLSDDRGWNTFGYSFNIIHLAFESNNICHAATEHVKRGDCQQRIVGTKIGTEAGVDLCQPGLCRFSQRTKNV